MFRPARLEYDYPWEDDMVEGWLAAEPWLLASARAAVAANPPADGWFARLMAAPVAFTLMGAARDGCAVEEMPAIVGGCLGLSCARSRRRTGGRSPRSLPGRSRRCTSCP